MAREVLALPKVRNTCPIWSSHSVAKRNILFSRSREALWQLSYIM